jgi:dinuclear metal center YbgI/SA1388 family protein
MPTVAEIVDLVHGWYPPETADSYDAVGLASGDPAARVDRVMLAVDVSLEVVREAADRGADLLLTHHPLLLRGIHSVAETTPKGRALAALARAGCALLTAHTNADPAVDGVSESMALALGLTDLAPLEPSPIERDKLVVYVPPDSAEAVRVAIAGAGAGAIGDYDSCSFTTPGEGRFRPLEGAHPFIGEVGRLEVVGEARVEALLPRARRTAVLAAMRAAHPYEEVAFDVFELADTGQASTGAGRIGSVEPTTLGDFAGTVARALPATPVGVLVGGDLDRPVRRVAVAGGAGDFALDAVRRTDAEVYVTSDLRHHPAIEFLDHGGPALVQVSHWAAEWTWLPVVERKLLDAVRQRGDTVETRVSALVTDPWTFRVDR